MRFKHYRSKAFEDSLHAEASQRLGKKAFRGLPKGNRSWPTTLKWAIYWVFIWGCVLSICLAFWTGGSARILALGMLFVGLWMGSSWWSRIREQHQLQLLYHLPVKDEDLPREATRQWRWPLLYTLSITLVMGLFVERIDPDEDWFTCGSLGLVVSLLMSVTLCFVVHLCLPWRFKFMPFNLAAGLAIILLILQKGAVLSAIGQWLPWSFVLEGGLNTGSIALVGVSCLAVLGGCLYYLERRMLFDHYQMQEFLGMCEANFREELNEVREEANLSESDPSEPVGLAEKAIWSGLTEEERWVAQKGGLCGQNYLSGLLKHGLGAAILVVIFIEGARRFDQEMLMIGTAYVSFMILVKSSARAADYVSPWFRRRQISSQSMAPLWMMLPVDRCALKGVFLKVMRVKAPFCVFAVTLGGWFGGGVYNEWDFAGVAWLGLFLLQTMVGTLASEGLYLVSMILEGGANTRLSENRNRLGWAITLLSFLIVILALAPFWPLLFSDYGDATQSWRFILLSTALTLPLLSCIGLMVKRKIRNTRKDLLSEVAQ